MADEETQKALSDLPAKLQQLHIQPNMADKGTPKGLSDLPAELLNSVLDNVRGNS